VLEQLVVWVWLVWEEVAEEIPLLNRAQERKADVASSPTESEELMLMEVGRVCQARHGGRL